MDQSTIVKEIENLVQLDGIPQETKDAILAGLAENILKRTLLDIMESLSAKEFELFNQMMDKGSIESALLWLSDIHPELDEKMKRTAAEVIEEFETEITD